MPCSTIVPRPFRWPGQYVATGIWSKMLLLLTRERARRIECHPSYTNASESPNTALIRRQAQKTMVLATAHGERDRHCRRGYCNQRHHQAGSVKHSELRIGWRSAYDKRHAASISNPALSAETSSIVQRPAHRTDRTNGPLFANSVPGTPD